METRITYISELLGFNPGYLSILKTQHTEKFNLIIGNIEGKEWKDIKHKIDVYKNILAYCDLVQEVLSEMETVLNHFDDNMSNYGRFCNDIGISDNNSCLATTYLSHSTSVFSPRSDLRDYISFNIETLKKFKKIVKEFKKNNK